MCVGYSLSSQSSLSLHAESVRDIIGIDEDSRLKIRVEIVNAANDCLQWLERVLLEHVLMEDGQEKRSLRVGKDTKQMEAIFLDVYDKFNGLTQVLAFMDGSFSAFGSWLVHSHRQYSLVGCNK